VARRPGSWPGFSYVENRKKQLKLLVEVAHGTRDVDAARDTALAVLYALDDARGLAALGTVCRLRRVHDFLAVTCFCDLGHWLGVSPSWGCLCTHLPAADGFNGAALSATLRARLFLEADGRGDGRNSLSSVYNTDSEGVKK